MINNLYTAFGNLNQNNANAAALRKTPFGTYDESYWKNSMEFFVHSPMTWRLGDPVLEKLFPVIHKTMVDMASNAMK